MFSLICQKVIQRHYLCLGTPERSNSLLNALFNHVLQLESGLPKHVIIQNHIYNELSSNLEKYETDNKYKKLTHTDRHTHCTSAVFWRPAPW